MKISSPVQIVLACSVLIAAAAGVVLVNPATDKKTTLSSGIQQAGNSYAIKNVRVFDGEKIIEKTSVLINKEKFRLLEPISGFRKKHPPTMVPEKPCCRD